MNKPFVYVARVFDVVGMPMEITPIISSERKNLDAILEAYAVDRGFQIKEDEPRYYGGSVMVRVSALREGRSNRLEIWDTSNSTLFL